MDIAGSLNGAIAGAHGRQYLFAMGNADTIARVFAIFKLHIRQSEPDRFERRIKICVNYSPFNSVFGRLRYSVLDGKFFG